MTKLSKRNKFILLNSLLLGANLVFPNYAGANATSLMIGMSPIDNLYYEMEAGNLQRYLILSGGINTAHDVVGAIIPSPRFESLYVGNRLTNNSFDLVAMFGDGNTNRGTVSNANNTPYKDMVNNGGTKNLLLGFNNTTNSYYNTVLGQNNYTGGGFNYAGGYNNNTSWNMATALGNHNFINGWGSVGVGNYNKTDAPYSLNFGNNNDAHNLLKLYPNLTKEKINFGANGVNLGNNISNTAINGIAIGNQQQVLAPNGLALGSNNIAAGINTVALGTNASVMPVDGMSNNVNANGISTATLNNGMALGYNAITSVSDGIALGSYAKAQRAAGSLGYDPNVGKNITLDEIAATNNGLNNHVASGQLAALVSSVAKAKANVIAAQNHLAAVEEAYFTNENMANNSKLAATVEQAKAQLAQQESAYQNLTKQLNSVSAWQGQLSPLSVGDENNGLTRQITGVAAGTADTDAVNVAQLKQLKPLDYVNVASPTEDLLNLNLNPTNSHLNSGATGTNSIAIGFGSQGNSKNSIALGTLATVKNNDNSISLGYGAQDGRIDPSVTASFSNEQWQPNYGVLAIGNKAYELGSTNIPDTLRRIQFMAGGVEDTDGVNVAQLTALANMVGVSSQDVISFNKKPGKSIYTQIQDNTQEINKLAQGWTVSSMGNSRVIKATDTVNFNPGGNIFINQVSDANGAILEISVDPTPTFHTVTVGYTGHEIQMNGTNGIILDNLKITGLAPGTIAPNSQDAINGSQLNTLKTYLENEIKKISVAPAPPKPVENISNYDPNVVYTTDQNGNPLERAKNGLFYPKGTVVNGKAPAGLTGTQAKDVILRLVNGDTTTTNPIVLGNVADGVTDNDAVNLSQLNKTNAQVAKNTDNIETNTGNIQNNAANIADNKRVIISNERNIAQNFEATVSNADKIQVNEQAITANKEQIGQNQQAIAANSKAIKDNANNIAANTNKIQAMTTTVNDNSKAIAENVKKIGDNADKIGQNTLAIGIINNQLPIMENKIAANGDKIAINTDSINKLNNGEAGPIVYTNEDNQLLALGKDGKFYLASQVNNEGDVDNSAQPATNVRLSLVNNPTNLPNSIGDNIILGNVAKAIKGTDAVPLDQLKEILQDKGLNNDENPVVTYDSDAKKDITLGGKKLNGNLNVPQGVAIHNVANGVAPKDAVNVEQLQGVKMGLEKYVNDQQNNFNRRFNELSDDIAHTGSLAAALGGLTPINYVPGETGQIMANVGIYRGTQAIAIGLARYNTPNLLFKTGLAYGGNNHLMASLGFTWRFGKGLRALPKNANDAARISQLQKDMAQLQNINTNLNSQLANLNDKYTTIMEENKVLKAELEAIKIRLGM